MAKDPAVLFYTSDFLTGTMTMTDEQKGRYITLLCIQHQKGVLSEEDMQSICKGYDKQVFSKFVKTDDGYYNERMKTEKERRSTFCQSRRNNANKTKKQKKDPKPPSEAYAMHMEYVNENTSLLISVWIEKYILDSEWLSACGKSLSVGIPTVMNLLTRFKDHCATQKSEQKTESDFRNHFLNWARKQKGTNQNSSGYISPVFGN